MACGSKENAIIIPLARIAYAKISACAAAHIRLVLCRCAAAHPHGPTDAEGSCRRTHSLQYFIGKAGITSKIH